MAPGDHTVVGTMTANKVAVTDTVVVANLNADKVDGADKDIDGTLAGNSDASVPTEKAVKTYVDTHKNKTVTGTHGSQSAATGGEDKLIHRDGSGRAQVAAPSAAADIARKDTVDAVQTNLNTHAALTGAGTHGSTVAATEDRLVHRDGAGRAKVVAPAAAEDIALKSTVTALGATCVKLTGNQTVAGIKTFSSRFIGGSQLLHVRDEKAAGTNGGTFTTDAWQTRTLNTVKTNEISGASLSSNQITLPAGTYEIEAWAPAAGVGYHQLKLYNTSDTADTLIGTSESSPTSYSTPTKSRVCGRFTIAAQKTFELQHRCVSTKADTGFGVGTNFGVVAVFAEVLIRRIA